MAQLPPAFDPEEFVALVRDITGDMTRALDMATEWVNSMDRLPPRPEDELLAPQPSRTLVRLVDVDDEAGGDGPALLRDRFYAAPEAPEAGPPCEERYASGPASQAARATEWVRFVVPSSMHPDHAGKVCPALVLRDAEEGEITADLLVLWTWAHHEHFVTGALFDEYGSSGSWHRDRLAVRLPHKRRARDSK